MLPGQIAQGTVPVQTDMVPSYGTGWPAGRKRKGQAKALTQRTGRAASPRRAPRNKDWSFVVLVVPLWLAVRLAPPHGAVQLALVEAAGRLAVARVEVDGRLEDHAQG